MSNADGARTAEYWIKLYGWVVIAAGLYGVTVAHLPVILGHDWAVCIIDGETSIPCVLTIHLYDASLTILLLLFGWYSLRRGASDIPRYLFFLMVAIAIEIAFFTFEAVELLWNFHNDAATWENYIIASIAVILLGGFLLGSYVHVKVSALTSGGRNVR